ncbi:MAG: hypothetical protein JNK04_21300 [Myxococcales bacterium]|nr:hypothetical protein [Myxococcales bacterium]
MSDDGHEIARWEWGKRLHELRPLYAERAGLTRVGPLAAAPAEPKGFTEYGFDAEGRLIEARAHRGRGRVDVERYRYGETTIDVEHVAATPGVPTTRSQYELADGHIVAWRWHTLAGLVEETYSYTDDRVTSIRTEGPNDPPRIFRCEWAVGGLQRITVEQEGSDRVVEVFRAAAPSPPDEVAALEGLLFDAIVQHVRAFAVDSPAYALLLVENDGYDAIPPELAIGLARERGAWLAGGTSDLRERSWSPEDLSWFDKPGSHLDEEEVQSSVRAFQDSLRASNRPEEAHRLNVRLAKRLNDESARLELPKTDDFVVVVVGLDSGIRRAELETYVPASKLAALRTTGWL